MSAIGRVVDECESTNDLARELGRAGEPHGAWVSARRQTRGRGRLGRRWESLEGNLFLSVVGRIPERALWTWVPLVTALAIARFLRERYEGVDVRVKWPNDLWIGRAKLGGLLSEAVAERSGDFLVVGIGLNCATAPSLEGVETASLSGALGRSVDADDVRSAIVDAVVRAWGELRADGTTPFEQEYGRLAALPAGSTIRWGTDEGVVLGLGPSGELRVRRPSGETASLYAEDVSPR